MSGNITPEEISELLGMKSERNLDIALAQNKKHGPQDERRTRSARSGCRQQDEVTRLGETFPW